jgi:hypothetical protein
MFADPCIQLLNENSHKHQLKLLIDDSHVQQMIVYSLVHLLTEDFHMQLLTGDFHVQLLTVHSDV